jgi:hypothetical protein
MKSVFLWCFIAPMISVLFVAAARRWGWTDRLPRGYGEWVVLFFPVAYSIFVFGSEMLRGLPNIFRRGGAANVLQHSVEEVKWRQDVCEQLRARVHASAGDWSWIHTNFRMELQAMRYRNRYLVILAGAVFFLILEGVEVIGPSGALDAGAVSPSTFFHFMNAAIDEISRVIALGFVLVLLYLSGTQLQSNLERFLNSVELLVEED